MGHIPALASKTAMSDDVFAQIPIFQDLAPVQLELLRPLLNPWDCYAGEALFDQGDPAEFIYLIVSGEVTVRYKPEDGEALNVARIRPGGLVGWSAALGSRYYTSGAFCNMYTQLVRIRGEDLRRLCEADHETARIILERLASVVADRLHHTREQVFALLEQSLQAGAYPHPE
jgi:CRP-like cAMP-binding protein